MSQPSPKLQEIGDAILLESIIDGDAPARREECAA